MKTNTTSSPVSDRVAQPTIATPTTVSRYYSEPEKLTYDEAEVLVERYFRQDVARSVTRVKHVLTEFGYPYSNHNHQRVMVALRNRCELHSPERSGPMRFKIPERYRSGGDAQ